MSSVPLFFFMAVWGDRYLDAYLETSLPTFLSPRNFGASRPCDRYYLYTTAAGAGRLRQSPAYEKLSSQIQTEVRVFDDRAPLSSGGKAVAGDAWRQINGFYNELIPESAQRKAAMIILESDSIWADGSFESMHRIFDSGKRVLLLNGILTAPERFTPALREQYYRPDTAATTIAPRQLVQLAMTHMGDYHLSHCATAPLYNNSAPGILWWPVEGEGMLVHNMSGGLQGVIHPESGPAWPIGTGAESFDYVTQIDPSWEAVHIPQDSDEICMAALQTARLGDADYANQPDLLCQPASLLRLARHMKQYLSPRHLSYYRLPWRWHYAELSEKWWQAERQAGRTIDTLLQCMEFFDRVPEIYEDLQSQFEILDSLRQTQKHWVEANAQLQQPLSLAPQPPHRLTVQLQMGRYFGGRENFADAAQAFQQAARIDIRPVERAINETLQLLVMTGRPHAASQLLDHCLQALRALGAETR